MSLSTLKKSNSLDKLLGAVQAENQPQEKKSYVDERLWKPVLDKVGNGYAVIRFSACSRWRRYALGKGLEPCVSRSDRTVVYLSLIHI